MNRGVVHTLEKHREQLRQGIGSVLAGLEFDGYNKRHVAVIKTPTGSGKTFVSADAMLDMLDEDHRLVLASDDRVADWKERRAVWNIAEQGPFTAPRPKPLRKVGQIVIQARTHEVARSIVAELETKVRAKVKAREQEQQADPTLPDFFVPEILHWYSQSHVFKDPETGERNNPICARSEELEPYLYEAQSPITMCRDKPGKNDQGADENHGGLSPEKREELRIKRFVDQNMSEGLDDEGSATQDSSDVGYRCCCPYAATCTFAKQLSYGVNSDGPTQGQEIQKRDPDILVITHDSAAASTARHVILRHRRMLWIDESPVDVAVGKAPVSASLDALAELTPTLADVLRAYITSVGAYTHDLRLNRDILNCGYKRNVTGEGKEYWINRIPREITKALRACYTELAKRPKVKKTGQKWTGPKNGGVLSRMSGSALLRLASVLKGVRDFYGDGPSEVKPGDTRPYYSPHLWLSVDREGAISIYMARKAVQQLVWRARESNAGGEKRTLHFPVMLTSASPGTRRGIAAAMNTGEEHVHFVLELPRLPLNFGAIIQIFNGPSARTNLEAPEREAEIRSVLRYALESFLAANNLPIEREKLGLGTSKKFMAPLAQEFEMTGPVYDKQRMTIGSQIGLNHNADRKVFLFIGDNSVSDFDVVRMYEVLHGACIDEPWEEGTLGQHGVEWNDPAIQAIIANRSTARIEACQFPRSKMARQIGQQERYVYTATHENEDLLQFQRYINEETVNGGSLSGSGVTFPIVSVCAACPIPKIKASTCWRGYRCA
jgi:hypothetical protein